MKLVVSVTLTLRPSPCRLVAAAAVSTCGKGYKDDAYGS
jgi:hypothetical protein